MYLTLFVAVLALLMIGIGMLKYRKRSIAKNITSIVIIVLSAVISCIVTRLIVGFASDTAMGFIAEMYPDLFAQLDELPTIASLIPAFISMIVSPILFVFVMLIIRGLVSIFGRLMTKGFSAIHGSLAKSNLAVNLSLAVLGGLLICSIYTAPLVGFATTAHTVMEALPAEVSDETVTAIDDDFIEPFADSADFTAAPAHSP